MRYNVYSLQCTVCKSRNDPTRQKCDRCGGKVVPIPRCPQCQAENPPTVYECVSCSQPLRQRPVHAYLQLRVPRSVAWSIISVALLWSSYGIFNKFIQMAEANIQATVTSDQFLAIQRLEQKRRWEEGESHES